jgi:hypothetical protein
VADRPPARPQPSSAPAKGRSLKVEAEPATAPTEVEGPSGPPALSPFQGHSRRAPSENHSSNDTIRVVAMLMALGMTLVASAVVLLVVGLVGGAATGLIETPKILEPEGGQDTDVEIHGPRAQPKPVGGSHPSPAPGVADPVPDAPPPPQEVKGIIQMHLANGQLFTTIEAKCPSTPLVRRRAEVHGSTASIILPNNEDCKVTFQGSSPEYTYLRGGQTKTCSFSPTNCH